MLCKKISLKSLLLSVALFSSASNLAAMQPNPEQQQIETFLALANNLSLQGVNNLNFLLKNSDQTLKVLEILSSEVLDLLKIDQRFPLDDSMMTFYKKNLSIFDQVYGAQDIIMNLTFNPGHAPEQKDLYRLRAFFQELPRFMFAILKRFYPDNVQGNEENYAIETRYVLDEN